MKIDGKCTKFTHKWNFRDKRGKFTPMVPKILFLKNSTSQLSNAVSIVPIALLDHRYSPRKKKVVLWRTFIWLKYKQIDTIDEVSSASEHPGKPNSNRKLSSFLRSVYYSGKILIWMPLELLRRWLIADCGPRYHVWKSQHLPFQTHY